MPEELDLKLGAQRMHLEAKLIELGYEAIMDHGTNIVDGIMRSNPAYRRMTTGARSAHSRSWPPTGFTRSRFSGP